MGDVLVQDVPRCCGGGGRYSHPSYCLGGGREGWTAILARLRSSFLSQSRILRSYPPPSSPQQSGQSEHNRFPESAGVEDKLSLWIVGLAVARGRTTTACIAGAHGERGAGGRVGGLPSGMDRVNPGSQEPPGTDSGSYCRLTRRTGTVGVSPTAIFVYPIVTKVASDIKSKAL